MLGNLIGLWAIALGILEFWKYLELQMYGEIQERSVDTIITVLWLAFVLIAYFKGRNDGQDNCAYWHGLEDGRKEQKFHNKNEGGNGGSI